MSGQTKKAIRGGKVRQTKPKTKPVPRASGAEGQGAPTDQPAASPLVKRELTEPERRFVEGRTNEIVLTGSVMGPPAHIDEITESGHPFPVKDPQSNPSVWRAQLAQASGTRLEAAQDALYWQLVVQCVRTPAPARTLEGVLAHMIDIGPQDGLEGMLAVQIVSTHKLALEMLLAVSSPGQAVQVLELRLRYAERLMRLFAQQMDTLSRYRGKGSSQQKMTVEHIHVHQGAQAVVGNVVAVPPSPPGGGDESAAA